MVADISAAEDREVAIEGITGAYLNAFLKPKVLMILDRIVSAILVTIQPEMRKYLREDDTLIVKLIRALYGCLESAKLWYNLLSSTLFEIGYVTNSSDPCALNKTYHDGKQCTIVIYVDDMFISAHESHMIEEVHNHLQSKFGKVTLQRGEKKYSYLGMSFDYTTKGVVTITYHGRIFERFARSTSC
jgi:hypothetical protein